MAHDYLYRRTHRQDAYRLLVPPPPEEAAAPEDPVVQQRLVRVTGPQRAAQSAYWLPQRHHELADVVADEPVATMVFPQHAVAMRRAARGAYWLEARAALDEEVIRKNRRANEPRPVYRRAAPSAYTFGYFVPEPGREGELYEKLVPQRAPGQRRTGNTAYWFPQRNHELVNVAPSVAMPEGLPQMALPHRAPPRSVSTTYLVALATQIKNLLPGPPLPSGYRGVAVVGRPRVQATYGQSGDIAGWMGATVRQGYSVLMMGTQPATHAGGRVIQIDEEGITGAMLDDGALNSATITDEVLENVG